MEPNARLASDQCPQLGGDMESKHLLQASTSSCPPHPSAAQPVSADSCGSSTSSGQYSCLMVEPSPRTPPDQLLLSAERAVSLRLLPPLLLLVVISYLDRTALSFASECNSGPAVSVLMHRH